MSVYLCPYVCACLHACDGGGGGGGREGDSRPIHIHTVKCGEITITHVTDSSFVWLLLHKNMQTWFTILLWQQASLHYVINNELHVFLLFLFHRCLLNMKVKSGRRRLNWIVGTAKLNPLKKNCSKKKEGRKRYTHFWEQQDTGSTLHISS